MNAHLVLLQKKYARIIELFAKEKQISLDDALSIFYNSTTYQLMREGLSNLHCMSDGYLVDELTLEYDKK